MKSSKILVVEDEPIVGMELQETLEGAGYVVVGIVDSADQVINSFRKEAPDLLLMDVRLRSFIDGIDAVKRLRLMSNVPVVYLTAWSTPDVVRRAESTNPAGFLIKPVQEPLLLDTIRKALTSEVSSS